MIIYLTFRRKGNVICSKQELAYGPTVLDTLRVSGCFPILGDGQFSVQKKNGRSSEAMFRVLQDLGRVSSGIAADINRSEVG